MVLVRLIFLIREEMFLEKLQNNGWKLKNVCPFIELQKEGIF